MDLTPDFRKVVSGGKPSSSRSLSSEAGFPRVGGIPVVAVDFDGTIAEKQEDFNHERTGKPITNAIWALRTFKFNGWEVEIFTRRKEVDPLWEWVDKFATGLVDRINESRPSSIADSTSHKPAVDLFIDDRSEYWLGREIDWIEIMGRLDKRGFLKKGLLPLGSEGNNMIASFKEPIFREIIDDLRTEVKVAGESREELIRDVERYIKHLGLVNPAEDILVRAKVSGSLLECVLKLMVRDRFDPVGCIILAQQDREIDIDTMPPLLEDDLDEFGPGP